MKKISIIAAGIAMAFAAPTLAGTMQDAKAQAEKPVKKMKKCTVMKDGKKVEGMIMKDAKGKTMCHAMKDMKMDSKDHSNMDHSKMDHSKMKAEPK